MSFSFVSSRLNGALKNGIVLLTNRVARLIRPLAVSGMVEEVAENTYKPNAVTHLQVTPGGIGGTRT